MPISNKAPQFLFDANFLIALLDAADVHHEHARSLLEELQQDPAQFFISDVLINEVLSVLAKRCEAKKRSAAFAAFAKRFQAVIRDFPILCLYALVPQHYGALVRIMVRSEGRFNFHDSLLVLFLKEVPKLTLVTLDQDFKTIPSIQVLP